MKEKKPLTHPSFDELLALTVDELGDQRAHEVREHLLDCPDCLAQTRQLLQLPDEVPSPEMELSDAELAADWQRLSATLDEEEEESGEHERLVTPKLQVVRGSGQEPAATPTGKPPRRSTIWLIAALITGAVIGLKLGHWLSLEGPQANQASAAITQIIPRDFYVRGELEKTVPVNCPLPGGSFVWVLNFARLPDSPTAKVLVRSGTGRALGPFLLPINRDGQVVLDLPWASVSDGQYAIELGVEVNRQGSQENFAVSVGCR